MSLLGYHGFNNWENHFMEDENERDNILFGFELEAREDDSNYVENQLSPEQVACKLGEEFGNLFVYERDSSIGRGVEIISQPMTMNYYMAHIDLFKKLLKMLDKMNYVSTKGNKCGLHIHFNRKALGYNSKEFETLKNKVGNLRKANNLDHERANETISNIVSIMEVYKDDPCTAFEMKGTSNYNALEKELGQKMHKAIAIIQFKLEGQLLRRHKEFHMEDRCLLHRINPEKGTVTLADGKEYPMLDTEFPTIDWKHPYELTPGELDVMERLETAFRNCEKLQNHMRLLLDKGGLYKIYNGNLLFHGCIPLNEDGSLKEIQIYGKTYKGRELYDVLEAYVRRAFYAVDREEQRKGRDILWFIWASPSSPLFGKDKMTTFERYFIADKETHKETKGAYYHLLENEKVVDGMIREFGLDPETGHIINGHVPVHQGDGESPVKCNGKVIVIDGGFCKAYQKVTGIAGYTLIYNSYGLVLTAHEPFTSKEQAISKESDIVSNRVSVHYTSKRRLVGDTDTGRALKERIGELRQLLDAYRKGIIKEKK